MDAFYFQIKIEKSYLSVKLIGKLTFEGIEEATKELLKISEETKILRVLYDASELGESPADVRIKSIEYFKEVDRKMDKLASYLPQKKMYYAAKLMSRLSGTKNWRPFYDLGKAKKWLEND